MKDEMTTLDVMKLLKYSNIRGVSMWCRRYGVQAKYRQPGPQGFNVYSRADVEEGIKSMTGRGVGGGRPSRIPRQPTGL